MIMYTGFVIHDRGDYLGWACDEDCAQYLVESATGEDNEGDIEYEPRNVPSEHTCAACNKPIGNAPVVSEDPGAQ